MKSAKEIKLDILKEKVLSYVISETVFFYACSSLSESSIFQVPVEEILFCPHFFFFFKSVFIFC